MVWRQNILGSLEQSLQEAAACLSHHQNVYLSKSTKISTNPVYILGCLGQSLQVGARCCPQLTSSDHHHHHGVDADHHEGDGVDADYDHVDGDDV